MTPRGALCYQKLRRTMETRPTDTRLARSLSGACVLGPRHRSDSRAYDESRLLGSLICGFVEETSRSFKHPLATHASARSTKTYVVPTTSTQEWLLQNFKPEANLRNQKTPETAFAKCGK